MSGQTSFNEWIAGTSAPDVAKFNSSWWDLSGKSDSPAYGIYSGTYTEDYSFLGGGNSEFTLYNGTFDKYTSSETPFKNKVKGLSSNSSHVYIGTSQPDNFLYDVSSRSFTDLGVHSDSSSIVTVTDSYGAGIGGDYFLFGTQNPSLWKWNGSFYDISPGFFVNTIGASDRNSTHIMVGDTGGVIGLYNGSNWTDISSKLGFEGNDKIYAVDYGNFGGENFWLVGGTNGRIERLWVNGTSEDLSAELPGSLKIKSIGFNDEKNRFQVGGSSGNIYVYKENGFFENTPSFSWQNNVNYLDYNPYAPAGSPSETAPNISILEPLQNELFGHDDVNLSVKSDQDILKWNYNIDDGENRTAGREGIVYTDSAGNLKELYIDGSIRDFGVDASIVAEKAQLDDDEYPEIPFVDGSGNLKIIDRTGENSTLDTGISTSKLMIATGSWKGSKDYIFYPDQSDNSYIKKVRKGSVEETIGTGIAANGVLGPGDFNQDGDRDIVFLGTSDTIKWYDGGAVSSTGFSSFGSNNNKGVGKVTDVDGDGEVRVPYVTGSNNLALINYTGGKYNLNSNYGKAEKTRISALDWKGDEKKEIMHLGSSTNELKYMYLNGEAKFVKDENLSEVSGQTSVGLAVGRRSKNSINQTFINMSEGVRNITVWGYDGTYYGTDSVEFTVDLTPPSFKNYGNNLTDTFFRPDSANISGLFKDDLSGLNKVKLSTNETGSYENKSIYGSPENFDNISGSYELSDFIWENQSYEGNLSYSLWAKDAVGNYVNTPLDSIEVNEVNDIDLEIKEVAFNDTNLIETESFSVNTTVENYGARDVSVGVNMTEKTYNGSEWILIDEKSKNITFDSNSKRSIGFEEKAVIGPRRYSIEVDTDDEVDEFNESNNINSSIVDVSSNQIFYGSAENSIVIGSQKKLLDWQDNSVTGNLYYADNDASYDLADLEPLNGSDDLLEASSALNLRGHNDSIKKEYDKNDDGEPNLTKCMIIAGNQVCDIPFVNSTNNSNFQTGILYDSSDGSPFDGTQDLVFTSNVSDTDRKGKYGKYSYETRIPSTLSEQTGTDDQFVKTRIEIK